MTLRSNNEIVTRLQLHEGDRVEIELGLDELYQPPLISTLHFRHGPATVRAICCRTWWKGAPYWLALTTGMVRQSQRRLVLVIRRAKPKYTLDELFAGKTPEEWRAIYADGYDWGPDAGHEIVEE